MKILIFSLAMSLILHSSLKAQSKKEIINASDIVIEGDISDSIFLNNPDKEVVVRLLISDFPSNITIAPLKKYQISVKGNEHFRFVIPASSDRLYMNVDIEYEGQNTFAYWSWFDNIYILERGDRLTCKLSDRYFYFKGLGSEKLQCQSELYQYRYSPRPEDLKLINSKQYTKDIEFKNHKLDSIFNLQVKTVNKYASRLGEEMTKIMLATTYGLRYYKWFRGQRFFYQIPERYKAFSESKAYKNVDLSLNQKVAHEILVASPNYCDFIFEKIIAESISYKDGKIEPFEENLKRVFNIILSNYQGIMREKLLTMFFLANQGRPSTLNYLTRAMAFVKNTGYAAILLNIKETKSKGLPFFPFELEDDQGNIVKLSDFKDKVVLIDFWYTGCENCIKLNEAMAPVIEKYKNNQDLKFISISIDKVKKDWLSSVKRGQYTNEKSINLFTGGVGANHPMLKKYSIESYPAVFLLKDGKIFSSTPPIPLLNKDKKPTFDGNTARMISLIDKSLEK